MVEGAYVLESDNLGLSLAFATAFLMQFYFIICKMRVIYLIESWVK